MNRELQIAAVIVLYKEQLDETETFSSLLRHLDWPLLIYDNSPNPQEIKDANRTTYVHNPSNPGVSTAYNHAMEWARSISASHLLLLDSDSVFPDNAKSVYEGMVSKFSQDLILPSLFSQGKRVSPFYFHGGKTHYGEGISYGALSLGRILAINAGAMLPLDSIEDVKYNESLPLDWSDVNFFRKLSKKTLKTQHIRLVIQHGLSEHAERSLASAQYRFSLYLSGILIVADRWTERSKMLFWAKLKAVKLCYTYRTFWFGIEYIRKTHA